MNFVKPIDSSRLLEIGKQIIALLKQVEPQEQAFLLVSLFGSLCEDNSISREDGLSILDGIWRMKESADDPPS
jgi:hypothetical protein